MNASVCAATYSPSGKGAFLFCWACDNARQDGRMDSCPKGVSVKVFISWSRSRSKQVAAALHEWLPMVIQAIKPWMSDKDIDPGTRWNEEIGVQLEDSKIGVICLTPENVNSEWLLFEAGALAKKFSDSSTRVITLLHDVKTTDVQGPLAQFHHTDVSDRGDMHKVISSLNALRTDEGKLKDDALDQTFATWWEKLEQSVSAIKKPVKSNAREKREIDSMVEEVLEIVRGLAAEQMQAERLRKWIRHERERVRATFDERPLIQTHQELINIITRAMSMTPAETQRVIQAASEAKYRREVFEDERRDEYDGREDDGPDYSKLPDNDEDDD